MRIFCTVLHLYLHLLGSLYSQRQRELEFQQHCALIHTAKVLNDHLLDTCVQILICSKILL